ncbi:peroxide stress protein YaaA [Arenicella sp. 4NH20-0111]|uniref:peroxide stress protein YaaA n=1 Tax=Arenicella sp. 4NH20-0111 TaxID=3127648 RepID=UPI003105D341
MLIVISPAKTLDFETEHSTEKHSQPALVSQSERLIDVLTTLSPADIEKLMKISPKLSELNVARYHEWELPFSLKNAKQAVHAFKGDVYTGLDAESLNESDLQYSQDHLRILSGLYGVLRPLDLMQPYRLEMGIRLENPNGKNLYEFWGDLITQTLNEQLNAIDSNVLINLASNEYFKSVKYKKLEADVVTPVFKDWKNGQYKMISFFAKKARGLMTAWVIKNRIESVDELANFNVDGYQFSENDSDLLNPVFLRKQD